MIQKLMKPIKAQKTIYCHSGEPRARSEALALSSDLKKLLDSGYRIKSSSSFAGVTRIQNFYAFAKIGIWSLGFVCNLVLVIWDLNNFNPAKK